MDSDEIYISRCFELAQKGNLYTAPNPMVGCVLVYDNQIIGEGYHQQFGGLHAEVNAINSVPDDFKDKISHSTLYVSLEPCNHFGKTPPCVDLILEKKIKKVVISCLDTFSEVNGKGIQRLRDNGVEILTGVLEKKGRFMNRKFFTYQENTRPYITLKWSETNNSVIGTGKKERLMITSLELQPSFHKLRALNQGIVVGQNTYQLDNPSLDLRYSEGNDPVKIILDTQLKNKFPADHGSYIVFNEIKSFKEGKVEFIKTPIIQNRMDIDFIIKTLYSLKIQSILIEGGKKLLESFIEQNLWDEALITTNKVMNFDKTDINTVFSPKIEGILQNEFSYKKTEIRNFFPKNSTWI